MFVAVMPFLKNSIKVALLPILNSMSVMGIVTIPGMMTGQILSGTPPLIAVKYQQIIMFLITAAVALSTFLITTVTFLIFFDGDDILRIHLLERQKGLSLITNRLKSLLCCSCTNQRKEDQ
jgi:putative ABC transport system permease protein